MNIEDTQHEHVLIVRPKDSRIDAAVANQFRNEMIDRINQGNSCIILDLSNVDFIDSSGLGAIVSSFKTLGNKGTLALCNTQAPVDSLFKLTRIHKVLPIYDTQEEALRALVAK